MKLEDLMARAAKYDETLARDIRDYVHGRKYGLVYEASKPEFVCMWNKPIIRGDIVSVLPPRGVVNDTKAEDDSTETTFKVISISEGIATLRNEQTEEIVTAAVEDIVALARFNKPIYAGLKEIDRVECGGDNPYHVVINGENFHALQTLVYAFQGQVDCIYIDPPYNTGATDWKYNNNYVGTGDKYRHSKWLTFMEDRLKLAKKLLNPKESVLIVTIDEREYLRLGLLLEQLFPEAKIQMITDVISGKGVSLVGQFSRVEEYIFIVTLGDMCVVQQKSNMLNDEEDVDGEEVPVEFIGLRRRNTTNYRTSRPNQFYPFFVDKNDGHIVSVGDVVPPNVDRNSVSIPHNCTAIWPLDPNGQERIWGLVPDSSRVLLELGCLRIDSWDKKKQTGTVKYWASGNVEKLKSGAIRVKERDKYGAIVSAIYCNPESLTVRPRKVWNLRSHNASTYGTLLLGKILCEKRFPFPKSLYSVRDTIKFFVSNKPNALVVDFFAGSGTTLHAVNLLNAEDGGHRKCILVTNNEVNDPEDREKLFAKGLRPGDDEWEKLGIARHVTWQRTVCSIEGHDVNGNSLEGNYLCQDLPMGDGFKANAVLFDLEYLEPSIVSADLAFDHIAPILWLAGGCKGEILQRHKGYAIGETYAVLFDPRYKSRFVDEIVRKDLIKTVFIVTDAAERYRSLCAELPGCRVMQLYESYLRSFEINAIG